MSHMSTGRSWRAAIILGITALALLGPGLNKPAFMPIAHAQSTDARPHASGPVTIDGTAPRLVRQGQARLVGRLPATQMMRVVLGLRPPHLADEEQFLQQVQTRTSPLYHHFLSAAEWNARFSPSMQDEQAVLDWARAQGLQVTNRYPNRLLVDVAAPAGTIETAFGVHLNSYSWQNLSFYSTDRDPQVPASLSGIVESVMGLNSLETLQAGGARDRHSITRAPHYSPGPGKVAGSSFKRDGKAITRPTLGAAPRGKLTPHVTNGFYDPTDLYSSSAYDWKALYPEARCCNPFNNPAGAPPETSIAIATSGDFNSNDLLNFASRYGLTPFWTIWHIDGTPSCCNLETTLDAEWSTAAAGNPGSPTHIYVYEGADASTSTFADTYNYILSDGSARVMSTSWGGSEDSYCSSFCIGQPTLNSDHNIFNQMVGQGWTLVGATGDNGAYDNCVNWSVEYPAADPDMVAAGGTVLSLTSSGSYVGETSWGGPGCSNPQNKPNNGGGGGGCSSHFSKPWWQVTDLCNGMRNVPDISLNAGAGQNMVFNGQLQGVGGTSIVAPELAGFFAVENSYLLTLGNVCGGAGTSPCAPLGEAGPAIYNAATGASVGPPPHNPYYDITKGCTGGFHTFGECAGPGYDLATGLGSANMLQLAWAINWYADVLDNSFPTVNFSGPGTGKWYTTDQKVSWNVTVSGPQASGVAGYSAAWDSDPGAPNSTSKATPGSSSDSFYTGPQFPLGTNGSLNLAAAGQGCHTVNVEAWDNMGLPSGDKTYGKVCYDTQPPVSKASLSAAANDYGWYTYPVTFSVVAADPAPGSGVYGTYYSLCARCLVQQYRAPLRIATDGRYTIAYFSRDVAGNWEAPHFLGINLDQTPPRTTALVSGTIGLNGGASAPYTVSLQAVDNLSGVRGTFYQIDGAPMQAYSGPFVMTAPGNHTVTFHSVDNAGNVEATQSVTVSIAAATLSATPASGPAGSQATLFGNSYLANEPVNIYWDSPAGTPIATTTANGGSFSIAVTIPQTTAGAHTIVAVGQTSHQTASAPFTVTQ